MIDSFRLDMALASSYHRIGMDVFRHETAKRGVAATLTPAAGFWAM